MDNTALAGPLYDYKKEIKHEIKVCSKCFGLICRGLLPLFFTIASIR